MDVIPFTYNWNNKLDCFAFTTIRIYNPSKHFVGNKVRPMLKGVNKGDGTIIEVKTFLLHQMNNYMSYLDMGYGVDDGKKVITTMYPSIDFTTKKLAFILIAKEKP